METTQMEALEFSRRRNIPGVEIRYMHGKRYTDVVLTLMGKEIASKTEIMRRNVVVSTTYSLPTL